mmetsp:Transcript_65114/g.172482  ORF Transcript_65114/g.172482 Transcript_65114/m.172482 type:complete len:175 (-) Transcript_65114:370-894(-)|eukprot:CAMPEP_0194486382 /NCGR_PEP_ID=MMETSP0253-20130528/7062_1 /TAXON_ID=2966 /ORGANISM="Noctiluca scintillans" /LENGTH=174 /DNA_ID=CAMNT_0039326469 /DNA_START=49 /DNA_END=573 /DNA_ORIENTATION=-
MLTHNNHKNSVRLLAKDLAENSAKSGIAKTPGARKYLNRLKAEYNRESKLAHDAAVKLERRIEGSCCFIGIFSRCFGKKQTKTVDDKVKEESKDNVETVDTDKTLPTPVQEEEASMDEPEAEATSQTVISTNDFILEQKKTQVEEKSGGWLDDLSFTFLSSTQDNCCAGRAKFS